MYKKQMILQRFVCYFLLIAAALVFVYSLGILTDLYDNKLNFYAENRENPMVAGSEIYYDMQDFNKNLTIVGIVLILLAVAQFIFQNHNRRKYYIANYITVGVNTVAGILATLWALDNIFIYKAQYLQIDFEALKMWSEMLGFSYTDSVFWFDAARFVFGIFIAAVVLNALNLIIKTVLMVSEKRLISAGREVSAK